MGGYGLLGDVRLNAMIIYLFGFIYLIFYLTNFKRYACGYVLAFREL